MTTSCAGCGSPNDDGSRFCGVCGARIDPPQQNPETTKETAVLPPARGGRGVFDPSDASLRMPVTRAPTIAIVLLLVLDAGLATAGAMLMKAGLAKTSEVAAPAPAAGSASGSGSGSEAAPAPAPAPSPAAGSASGSGSASASAAASAVVVAPAGSGSSVARAGSGERRGSGSGAGAGSGSNVNGIVSDLFGHAPPDAAPPVVVRPPVDAQPESVVDPYAVPDAAPMPDAPDLPDATAQEDQHTSDLADEVERKSADSQSHFTHCYEDAARAYTPDQPLAGEVDIAFRVMPTGEVQNASPVKNTTGSDKLADCLTAVISAWTFSPSDLTEPAVFVRPLRFDGH